MNTIHTMAAERAARQSNIRDCWLYLLAEGGWWQPSEISSVLLFEVEEAAGRALNAGFKQGNVERRYVERIRQGGNLVPEYRVTPACIVPDCVSMKMIEDAMNGTKPAPRRPRDA